MKMSKERYPITTLYGLRERIDPTPDYQRPPAWTRKQKQLLIDTILRGYDIPKMYWQRMEKGGSFDFAVIDGQQRLRTIWEYCSGDFALARNADPIDGNDIAGLKYDRLDFTLRSQFDIYALDVVIVEEAIQNDCEDEVRDMFLRLQNGTTLKAQEKRNAMPGEMRDFVKELAKHRFFENCKFKNARFTFDHIAAQITALEIAGEPTNVRDSDLNRLYSDFQKFDPSSKVAKKIRRTLNFLASGFPEKTPELERYSVVTLYCLSSSLIDNFASDGVEHKLADWFLSFEKERREQEALDEDSRDTQLIEYRRFTSQSTDAEESIKSRLETMERRFFLAYPNIEQLDDIRIFSHEQRLAIYRRDEGRCQIRQHCQGEKLPWDNWHADHKVAYANGGKTTVSNGQVACTKCNLAKSAN